MRIVLFELASLGEEGFCGDVTYRLINRQFRRCATDVHKETSPAPEMERRQNHMRHGVWIGMWLRDPGQTELEVAMSNGLITRVRSRDVEPREYNNDRSNGWIHVSE